MKKLTEQLDEIIEGKDTYTMYIANTKAQRLGALPGKKKSQIVQPVLSLSGKTKREAIRYYDLQIKDHKRRGFDISGVKKTNGGEETALTDSNLEDVWVGYYKEIRK